LRGAAALIGGGCGIGRYDGKFFGFALHNMYRSVGNHQTSSGFSSSTRFQSKPHH
jgi:hypothetical protein